MSLNITYLRLYKLTCLIKDILTPLIDLLMDVVKKLSKIQKNVEN